MRDSCPMTPIRHKVLLDLDKKDRERNTQHSPYLTWFGIIKNFRLLYKLKRELKDEKG